MYKEHQIHSTYYQRSIMLPRKDASGMWFAEVVLGALGLHAEVLYTTPQHSRPLAAIRDCEDWLGVPSTK